MTTWTGYHTTSLQNMYRFETKVKHKRRDRPLIKRIKRCLEYLGERANRDAVPPHTVDARGTLS